MADVLDPDRFGELFADFGDDGAREVIAAFLRETDRQMAALREATGEALADLAHAVKGGGMLVGAVELRAAALEVERLAREDGDTRAALARLDAAWVTTREALTR